MRKVLLLNDKDNVAVALVNLRSGDEVELTLKDDTVKIRLLSDIPFGHKFSIKDIREGEYVIKYGEVIGVATSNICTGEHVHIHNVKGLRGRA